MSKRFLLIVVLALAAIALLIGYFFKNNGYEVVTPSRGAAVQAVYATGVVEPVNSAMVSAQITGRIGNIKAFEGDEVKDGQLLASLEDSVEQARITELKARLAYLDHEVERKLALNERDVASQRDYEQALSERNATQAQLESQEELVARMQVTAPLAGTVLRRDIEPGELAMQGVPIYWIGQPTPLRITAEVDEEDIPLVELGQEALIKADAFPQEVFKGAIAEITPKGDPINKSFRVRVSVPDDTKLLIGMTVEVNVVTDEVENALLVPASSVIRDTVWVKRGSKIKKQKIKTGIKDEEHVQVLDGLNEDDEILLNPGLYLAEKQKKKP